MQKNFNILILNGPNLNMLGIREPEKYGALTLGNIIEQLKTKYSTQDITLADFQSNAEHELIEKIHKGYKKIDFIIINPGAFTHTSVAIRDALLSVNIPFIEVHLSNVHAREPFRHHSYLSDVAKAVICGMGHKGYDYAVDFAIDSLRKMS
ncbi:type II 3-dehydroquinate dehydratase [Thorsellia kenyensis]|uniref:3-dehydroquinate dehydratase n=1 Tax=Thorsellia kenyensis TaxID=1549888 RepID=A0ABV6C6X5_9GAMM